jgi:hypothetical protein
MNLRIIIVRRVDVIILVRYCLIKIMLYMMMKIMVRGMIKSNVIFLPISSLEIITNKKQINLIIS